MTDPTGYEGWSGKFDLYAHNQEWCDCGTSTATLAEAFKEMAMRKSDGKSRGAISAGSSRAT